MKVFRLGLLFIGMWLIIDHLLATTQDSLIQEADRILTESVMFAISLNDFETDFFYEFQSPHRRSVRKQGKMLIKDRGAKYALLTQDQEVYVDGENVWVYSTAFNEVQISYYDGNGENVLESIFQLFRYKEKAKYLGEEAVLGNLCDKILVPFPDIPAGHYKEAYVWVGQAPRPRMIEKVTFIDGRQMSTSYTFTALRTNVGLGDEDFRFNVNNYPDIQLLDVR